MVKMALAYRREFLTTYFTVYFVVIRSKVVFNYFQFDGIGKISVSHTIPHIFNK